MTTRSGLLRVVRWPAIGLSLLAVTALGTWGFLEQGRILGIPMPYGDALYHAIQLFVLEWNGLPGAVPVALEVARFAAPILAALAAVKAAAAVLHAEVARLRLRVFGRGHVIVCGGGADSVTFARSLRRSGRRVALVPGSTAPAPGAGIAVFEGDPADPAVLRSAGARRSRHVVALDRSDATNAAIVAAAAAVAGPGTTMHMRVGDPHLAVLLRTEALMTTDPDRPLLELFDLDETAARAVLARVRDGGRTSPVIVAAGGLGERIALEAVRSGFDRVRVVGSGTGPLAATLARASPDDGRWQLLAVGHDALDAALRDCVLGPDPSDAVVIFLDDDRRALSLALDLVQEIKGSTLGTDRRSVDVIVETAHPSRLAALAEGAYGADSAVRLTGFDPVASVLDDRLLTGGIHEDLARALHTLDALASWDETADGRRAACRRAARLIGPLLRDIGCDLVPWSRPGAVPIAFTPAEVDLLAVLEQERATDITAAADDGERDAARHRIRRWPEALAAAGQCVVRLERSPARTLHEAYLRRRRHAGDTPDSNASLVPWDRLPESLKASNRDQVAHLRLKLRAIGCDLEPGPGAMTTFTDDEIERMAVMEHDRWVAHRRSDGWTPGPVKDGDRRVSPHLVPWDDLDEALREIDRDFVRDIPTLAGELGGHIVRRSRSSRSD